ncbi:Hemoglobin-like flavoprotein [Pseudooceanicola antarcticus]|uniref:Hemin receptor n=1 Tax=Pseudooceanicola antarcticus TaxID=1247613 RepID=A0A285HUH4_9RHOB|nr:globin family protein [Pseudooceanicola antarcticus]PJE27497.1 hemin receptor [Pseudooceanicola antarcticus]SNY39329.1 Hemoglobin-like flavoprotein [Pseudooceanicola antarcticus]
MDTSDIALVQGSFAKVWPIKGKAAELFYADLFETAPEVKPLFARADMQKQGDKLMQMLSAVVKGLNDIPALLPVAADLALRHSAYGVQPAHYDAVGASLLRTLETGLGEAFTPEVKTAWTKAYTTLSGAMIDAAYPTEPPASAGTS